MCQYSTRAAGGSPSHFKETANHWGQRAGCEAWQTWLWVMAPLWNSKIAGYERAEKPWEKVVGFYSLAGFSWRCCLLFEMFCPLACCSRMAETSALDPVPHSLSECVALSVGISDVYLGKCLEFCLIIAGSCRVRGQGQGGKAAYVISATVALLMLS